MPFFQTPRFNLFTMALHSSPVQPRNSQKDFHFPNSYRGISGSHISLEELQLLQNHTIGECCNSRKTGDLLLYRDNPGNLV